VSSEDTDLERERERERERETAGYDDEDVPGAAGARRQLFASASSFPKSPLQHQLVSGVCVCVRVSVCLAVSVSVSVSVSVYVSVSVCY
jgi:hypothetical protein